jgi:hypothetical protein
LEVALISWRIAAGIFEFGSFYLGASIGITALNSSELTTMVSIWSKFAHHVSEFSEEATTREPEEKERAGERIFFA